MSYFQEIVYLQNQVWKYSTWTNVTLMAIMPHHTPYQIHQYGLPGGQRVFGSIHIWLRKGVHYLCNELLDTLYYLVHIDYANNFFLKNHRVIAPHIFWNHSHMVDHRDSPMPCHESAPIQTTPRLVLLDKCQLPLAFSIAPCAQSEIGAWDQEFTKVGG